MKICIMILIVVLGLQMYFLEEVITFDILNSYSLLCM